MRVVAWLWVLLFPDVSMLLVLSHYHPVREKPTERAQTSPLNSTIHWFKPRHAHTHTHCPTWQSWLLEQAPRAVENCTRSLTLSAHCATEGCSHAKCIQERRFVTAPGDVCRQRKDLLVLELNRGCVATFLPKARVPRGAGDGMSGGSNTQLSLGRPEFVSSLTPWVISWSNWGRFGA